MLNILTKIIAARTCVNGALSLSQNVKKAVALAIPKPETTKQRSRSVLNS